MSNYHFLFTYQVVPNKHAHKKLAEAVRSDLAEITEISKSCSKVDNIDTTFSGKIKLKDATDNKKRKEAEDTIKKLFKKTLKDNKAADKVKIYTALMIDGLGKRIEFKVS